MFLARALSVILRWTLALSLGLGPLGADVLAALGHAQVCACCRSEALESCCAAKERDSAAPRAVPENACACSIVAPSGTAPLAVVPRTSEIRSDARGRLARLNRVVELVRVELPLCREPSESSPAPPGSRHARGIGPPGSSSERGSSRASALGVLRL